MNLWRGMKMTLTQLRYFKMIVDTGYVGKAAEKLSITQPTLSKAIGLLEDELGVKLLEKSGRNIMVTRYGRCYYEHISRALDALERGNHELKLLQNEYEGEINLGFSYSLGESFIPNTIQAFQSEEGNEKIHFRLKQANSLHIMDLLKDEKVDVAICSYRDEVPGVEFVPVLSRELVALVGENHPLAAQDSIQMSDLEDEPFIHFNSESSFQVFLNNLFAQKNVHPQINYEVNEDSLIAGLVEKGFGVSIVPRIMILDSFNIKALPISDVDEREQINFAYLKNGFHTMVVKKFIEFMKEMRVE